MLADLGLQFHLGHGGRICPKPRDGPKDFRVFDTSGAHRISIAYCGCTPLTKEQRLRQLLRAGWFPGTITRPQTVFTFDLLDMFHELTLQSKTTLYDFYHTIIQRTDKMQLGKIPVCYVRPLHLQELNILTRAVVMTFRGRTVSIEHLYCSSEAPEVTIPMVFSRQNLVSLHWSVPLAHILERICRMIGLPLLHWRKCLLTQSIST